MNRREFLRFGINSVALAGLFAAFPGMALARSVVDSFGRTVGPADVIKAAERISGRVRLTPCVKSGKISVETGTELYLKLENLQYTGAFKERGALNRISVLTPDERNRGVIAASAGNHSQGVAHHATLLDIPSVIVMPHGTPNTKISHTKALGADVIVEGESFDEALNYALKMADEEGLTFIHPFDDPMIIAGQGTIGLEIMEAVPDLDALIVPVGGGGLIAGCATAAKSINPGIKIYGVEPVRYQAMYQRMHDQPVKVGGETIAEGLAVHNVGELPFVVVNSLVEDILLVPETTIEEAITMLFDQQKIVAEGAAAVGVAALLEYGKLFEGKKVATVITGGNIDSNLFASLLQRDLARSGQLSRLHVRPDRGGRYHEMTRVISEGESRIIDARIDPIFHGISAKAPAWDIVVETRDSAHAEALAAHLREKGFETLVIE